MKYILWVFCFIQLFYPPAGLGADHQEGFILDVVVDANVAFVFNGEQYHQFSLEYLPGQMELLLDGQPLLNIKRGPTEDECDEKYKENKFIEDLMKDGMSCRDAYFVFDKAINTCLQAARTSLLEAEKTDEDEEEKIAQIYSELDRMPEGSIVERVFFERGTPKVIFKGYQIPITVVLDPIIQTPLPEREMPEGELLFNYAMNLKLMLEAHHNAETLVAVGPAGGTAVRSGPGMLQKVQDQIAGIHIKGDYVDGPIPRVFLHN